MRRKRLRPAHTQHELVQVYPKPHDSTRWHDHNVRVAVTIAVGLAFQDVSSCGDLSCGNGLIARAIADKNNVADEDVHLGDFAEGYRYTGPIEQTINEMPKVDVYVMSETLEHLDDPDAVLQKVRRKCDRILISTPVDKFDDQNFEHYWAWDRAAVERMMHDAGFDICVYNELDMTKCLSPYKFGIWAS